MWSWLGSNQRPSAYEIGSSAFAQLAPERRTRRDRLDVQLTVTHIDRLHLQQRVDAHLAPCLFEPTTDQLGIADY